MQDTPSPADFVRILAPALRQAASIARALEGRVANRPKDGESTAVKAALTVADTASQEALLTPLLEHFPGVSLAAEEDTPLVEHFPREADGLVVIDPIDGTLRFYLEGLGPYATMIGIAIEGRYEASLVALPRERLYFGATRSGGAFDVTDEERPRPVRVTPTAGRHGGRLFVSPELPVKIAAALRERGYDPVAACGGAISVAPLVPGVCGGLRVARENPEGVSIRGRIGALIAAEAGALVAGPHGGFPSAIHEPSAALMVAGRPEVLADLRAAFAAG